METILSDSEKEQIYFTGGFAHPGLTAKIAKELGVEVGGVEQGDHPNGEIYSRFTESVRGKQVFITQPHVGGEHHSVNDAIMQQCLLADAARSSSAREITAVSPYLAYTRQDRKSRGREPIGIRVLIDQLTSAGVDRIVAVDMHSPQSQAIFRGPFDHLTAQIELRKAMIEETSGYDKSECMVIAPDAGASKMAERHQRELGVSLLHLAKMRDPNDTQKIHREERVPEVDGRVCLVFDDMIDTAGTLVSAAEALKNSGAKAIYVAASHAIFSGPAVERLSSAPIDKILVTDTFPTQNAESELGSRIRVVSVAQMVANALTEIIQCGSVSRIFNEQNYA